MPYISGLIILNYKTFLEKVHKTNLFFSILGEFHLNLKRVSVNWDTERALKVTVVHVCTPVEDSDQPARLRSLIRVFNGRSMDSQRFNVCSCGKLSLWSDCVDAQTNFESSLYAHANPYLMLYSGSNIFDSIYESVVIVT